MGYLDQLIAAEARMLSEQQTLLDRELPLVESAAQLYELLGLLVNESKVGLTVELTAALSFLLACRHRLYTATLAMLRGSHADAFIHTRLAIENAAFARRVLNHPHLAELWMNAGDSEQSYAQYREKFPPSKLFPKDHQILRELHLRYDYCSKQSHPSLASFTGRLRGSDSGEKQTLSLRHFDVVEQEPELLRAMVVWLAETHLGMLRMFAESLVSLPGFPRKQWQQPLGVFERKLEVRKKELKPYFLQQAEASKRDNAG